MRFYYVTLSELKIAETRLKTLENKKKMLRDRITNTTSTIKEDVSKSSFSNDKMDKYLIQVEDTDFKIKEVKEEIEILKKGLKQMEDIQKNLSGLEEQIFRLYFVEQKTPTQITYIVPCSMATVYRYINLIKNKVEKK